jgi:hypothetical protein
LQVFPVHTAQKPPFEETLRMKHGYWHRLSMAFILALVTLSVIWGCDSGEKAIDEITGNRAVKQYHKSKKDIEKIADRQAERYESIPDDDTEGN